jgi:pimeloyl-ACP methyl ester carboxylesterase
MRTKSLLGFILSVGIVLGCGFGRGERVSAQENTVEGQYASVNGLELYYEIHGTGEPLVLLHGGLGTIDMFAAILPTLAETRQVIAVDLQGHGHTADIDRSITYEAMADDVAALIEHLGFENADIMGYSLGGGVALQTAIRHPEVVRKLVLLSTAFKQDGWFPEVLAGMSAMNAEAAQMMLETPMYAVYASAAPRVEDWPVLVSKLGDLLRQDYDWSAEVAEIEAPALIVIGDADSIRPSHAVELFELFGGGQVDGGMNGLPDSQFAVLPATTHFTIFTRADLLMPIITPFLDAPLSQTE